MPLVKLERDLITQFKGVFDRVVFSQGVDLGRADGGVVLAHVGLGFDATLDDLDIDLYKKIAGETAMNRWDFGLGLLLGYEFDNGFQINAGYQIGLINQADDLAALSDFITGSNDAKMRTQTVNVGIGYRF